MKFLKKTTTLLLALSLTAGMTAGFAACGGDKGGDNNSVDTGAAKGEQVTLEQWTAAVTNTFAADNVTMNTFEDMHMEEVWDSGEHMVYEGTSEGVIKLAGNVSYEKNSGTGTVNGVSATEFKEEYNYVNDGMYYEWSRASADGEWGYRESPYYAGMFDGTVGEVIFGGESFSQELISRYGQLQYDESKGEYSVSVDDEGGQDPATLKIKIVDDKFYTLTIRFEDTAEESPSEYGYVETKYVFVNYGTTSVKLPNEEEEEGGEDSSSQGGEVGSVDTGEANGVQVTLEEWTTAVANTLAMNNVTANTFADGYSGEDDEPYSITSRGYLKLANGIVYQVVDFSATENGMSISYTEENYMLKEDGVYYNCYKGYGMSEWMVEEYFDQTYSATLGDELFSRMELDAMTLVMLYTQLEYDESKGEYSVFIDDEYDPFVAKFKVKDGKFYTFSMVFNEETGDDGYLEEKWVFVDHGTTVIDGNPNLEDFEGGDSEPGTKPGTTPIQPSVPEGGGAVTAEEWNTAIAATLAQTNFVIDGTVTMEAMGSRGTGTETLVFEEKKMYHEEDTVTGVYRTYWGSVFDESYGGEVPYEWNWDNDTSSWDCEYSSIGSVDANEAFYVLTCETYIDHLPKAYDNAVYNSEKGCYVIDLASWVSEWNSASTVTGTLEITFANGLIAKIKGVVEDELFEGYTMSEEYEYVITYGKATVGNLPAVTI